MRLGWAPSRRAAKDLIFSGRVRVNGNRSRKGEPIAPGDRVEIDDAPYPAAAITPDPDLHIELLYEDAAMIVVAKPGLMPCYPLRPGERGTIMNAAVAQYPETATIGDHPLEGGLVHRLDNGTSGALIIARTEEAFTFLRGAIQNGLVMRCYRALVAGRIDHPIDIETPVAHHPKNPRRMVTVADASEATGGVRYRSAPRPAFTRIQPIERIKDFTLVEAMPRTGSRHQIRVHLAGVGHPIAGDLLYGGPAIDGLAHGRFWLHLAEIGLDVPSGKRVTVEAPLADDLAVLSRLV